MLRAGNHMHQREARTMRIVGMLMICCAALAGCGRSLPPRAGPAASGQDAFWASLQRLCGQAYAGTLTQGSAADSSFRTATLVMHVRQCSPGEVRIPFHVGENRSRTWIVTRTEGGLRLKHDHRHEDGGEDAITQYGGDTRDVGTPARQEFYADAHTATLIPAAVTNVWTMEVVPGERFAYALRREGTDRRFRVEFDLTRPVTPPPAPWGHQE
jgi:hypothetical protein